ncbi:MAG: hypothetical protein NTX35_06645 [Verrucomicrobia bacterium]|nr:hypothetical protein [Verrucomicrobiota bacterium]
MNWTPPPPRWDTLAGQILDAFFAAVHQALPHYDQPLTIFGSAPIQLCLDEDFASADVDIMVLEGGEMLRRIAAEAGLGRASTVRAAFGVQICPPLLFNPTPHYLQRARTEVRHGLTIIVPHLRDILIAKLHRSRMEGQESLIPKDRRAFQRVRELSDGHPTPAEFLQDLVNCESSFRPPHDGGLNSFRCNAENALVEIYGHHLDLKRDILDPAAIATQPPGHLPPGFIAEQIGRLER